jgi:hypothetical protein
MAGWWEKQRVSVRGLESKNSIKKAEIQDYPYYLEFIF